MDDSDFVPSSLKPSRTASNSKKTSNERCHESAAKKFVIESDCLLPDANESRCYVCNKDLRHLDELRRALHINNCLDQQEAKSKYKADKEKWAKTVDCPICGTPLQPGPFRAAHAKSCGRKHEVPGAQLLSLMDTQTKVADVRKKNGMTHTKKVEPKLVMKKPGPNKNEPKSEFDEQMKLAMALSASLDPLDDCVSVPEPKQSGRLRKQRPRSYSFVELQPRSCRCSVFEQIQENFVRTFKVKRFGDFTDAMRRRKIRSLRLFGDLNKCIHRLERLERLADDMRRFGSSGGDVTILSLGNDSIPVHRFIIAARAPSLVPLIGPDGALPLRDYSTAALRCYVSFLYSSAIEWTENERSDILQLANLYGPNGLAALCREPQPREILETTVDQVVTKKDSEGVVVESEAGEGGMVGAESGGNAKPSNEESTEILNEKILPNELGGTGTSFVIGKRHMDEVVLSAERRDMRSSATTGNSKGETERKLERGSLRGDDEKEGLEPVVAAASKTGMESVNNVNSADGNRRSNEGRKDSGADSDCSVIVLEDKWECVGGKVENKNESEDWDMESSGGWLDALLPPRDSSMKKAQDEGKVLSTPSCDIRRSNPAKSTLLTACRSPEGSPDIFGESSEDGDCDRGEKIDPMFQKADEAGPLSEEIVKRKERSPSLEDLDLQLKPGMSRGTPKDNEDMDDVRCEVVRESAVMAATERSLSPSFAYSPLPLPPDSFDDFMRSLRMSPDVREFGNVGSRDKSAGLSLMNSLGLSSPDKKRKTADCQPSTSAVNAEHSSLHLNTNEMPDSFFDSRTAQPTASTSLVRHRSERLSDLLCSSPKRRRRNLSESPKSSRRPPKLPKVQKSGSLVDDKNDKKAQKRSAANRHDVRDRDSEALGTIPFGVPVSPIRRCDPQPCSSRMAHLRSPGGSKGVKASVQYCSTPNPASSKLAQRLKELGSNVKVLKTSNITPMPQFDQMDDKQLKDELSKYGVRPMGRKRSIALLKKIYEEIHPVVELGSPVTSKPKSSKVVVSLASRLEREEGEGDRTLNETLDEEDIREESCLDAFDEEAPLPKDLDGMQTALLVWLRRKENEDLYNTLLGLNPIIFEEFCERLSRADTAVASIPKKALVEILDRLHITFSLPADGWRKRRERKQKTRGD